MANPTLTRQAGQVLVFFALVLPLVLLPAAAYAVDAAVTASEHARLVEVTVRAAEDAAEQIDVAALRAGGTLILDVTAATRAAQDDVMAEPGASVVTVGVEGGAVTVVAAERVALPLDFIGPAAVMMQASATARIASGYDSPSSRLPLPVSTF